VVVTDPPFFLQPATRSHSLALCPSPFFFPPPRYERIFCLLPRVTFLFFPHLVGANRSLRIKWQYANLRSSPPSLFFETGIVLNLLLSASTVYVVAPPLLTPPKEIPRFPQSSFCFLAVTTITPPPVCISFRCRRASSVSFPTFLFTINRSAPCYHGIL